MSEVTNENGASTLQAKNQTKQVSNETPAKKTMFYQNVTGQFYMLPHYHEYFSGLLGIIGVLYDTVNQKWTAA
jgi:hypothetical protein